MLEIKDAACRRRPNISVIGVGGGGNNAISRMAEVNVENVTYIAINTDVQVLEDCPNGYKMQIGQKLTGGYGAGADPAIGQASAKESEEEIAAMLEETDMVILTCGLGGGTGTGAIPFIAKMSKDRGILTVAIVTLPFSFEGSPRQITAKSGLEELQKNVDMLLVIPNDKLLVASNKPFYLEEAFLLADSVLKSAILGITNIIYNSGCINLDFNDIRTTLSNKGLGHLGIGRVPADGSLLEAVKQAVNSPLLETNICGATNILLNTSGRVNLLEVNEAMNYVREAAGGNVNIIWGTVANANSDSELEVTLIATGMSEAVPVKTLPKSPDNPTLTYRPIPDYQNSSTTSAPSSTCENRFKFPGGVEIPAFLMGRGKK